MLRREDGSLFVAGRARYLDALPGQLTSRDAKIYVRIGVGGFTTLAMLDTGSSFSVLDADLADRLGAFEEREAPSMDMATRHGVLRGRLVRRTIRLFAEDGPSLDVESTCWVSPEWRFGHFLGYAGLLARIRFALDPDHNQIYFGPTGA